MTYGAVALMFVLALLVAYPALAAVVAGLVLSAFMVALLVDTE